MADIQLIRGSNGNGPAVRPVVTAARSSGSLTIKVNSTTNLPPSFIGTWGKLNQETGKLVSSSIRDFYGTVNGADIDIVRMADGFTDDGNEAGDVIVLKPNTDWANNLADALLVSHNPDGTLANNSVTTAALPNNSVTTAKIASKAVTTAKIANNSVTMATLSSDVVSSGTYWVRFGDGTQICRVAFQSGARGMTEHGSIFYKDVSVGNWPKPFVGRPSCSVAIYNEWCWGNIYGFNGSSGGTVRIFRGVATATDVGCYVQAIGRWK